MQTILFLTRRCNFRCTYCYEFPPGSSTPQVDMPFEILRRTIDWALDNSGDSAGFGLFGGEPLLAWDLLVEAVEYATAKAEAVSCDVAFSLSTNGSLLTPERADFLAAHPLVVQYSLDGCREMHDIHRVTIGGKGTFAVVEKGLKELLSRNVAVDVVVVLTPENVAHLPDALAYLVFNCGADSLCLNISHSSRWDRAARVGLEDALEAAAGQLVEACRAGLSLSIDAFDEKIRTWVDGGYAAHQFCPFGEGKVAVDVGGDIYPCDRIAGDGSNRELIIGHVDTGVSLDKVVRLRKLAGRQKPGCPNCSIRGRCRHWCGCVNYEASGDVGSVSDLFCFTERLKVRLADRVAETLFAERNPAFVSRFYG